jgi:hypothetical protein
MIIIDDYENQKHIHLQSIIRCVQTDSVAQS